jgi:hypothetical protein
VSHPLNPLAYRKRHPTPSLLPSHSPIPFQT